MGKPGFRRDSKGKCTAAYFYLQDKRSTRCIHPTGGAASKNGVVAIFHTGCEAGGTRLQFSLVQAGGGYVYLKSRDHGRCIHPLGGSANKNNVKLVFHDGCVGTRLQFKVLPGTNGAFYLQSRDGGLCVHPNGGQATKNGLAAVFYAGCKGENIQFRFRYVKGTCKKMISKNQGKKGGYTYCSSFLNKQNPYIAVKSDLECQQRCLQTPNCIYA